MPLKLIAYIRVSSQSQTDNTSFESQTHAIEDYCKRNNHELTSCRYETKSASGRRARPIFAEVLNEVKSGGADGIVVCRLDRLARSTLEGLQVATDLKAANKTLVVLDLGFDTSTPIGACILSVLLAFAELERNMIKTRVDEGRKRVLENGFYGGGRPSYGFQSKGGVGKKLLVEDSSQQFVVSEMLRLRTQGFSTYKIAEHLNERGFSTKRGLPWNQSSIYTILKKINLSATPVPHLVSVQSVRERI